MAVAIIGPKFYAWDSDTGKPLAFGKVYTYQAGTNTPKATFTTEGGETQNANPVILNGAGYADIFLNGSYKVVVKDADDVEVWTSDPVSDPSQLQQEWVRQRNITQVNTTTFTVDGGLTDEYVKGVAIRVKQDSGFVFGTVVSATYADGKTTVELSMLDGATISSTAQYAERNIVTAFSSLGSDLIAHTGTSDTVTEALDKRTVFVADRAEMKALTVAVGTNVYLTENGRADDFVVKSGTPPSDPEEGKYVIFDNGNYAERVDPQATLNTRWFGSNIGAAYALGSDVVLPSDTLTLSSGVPLENDKRIEGIGGEFTSVLKADADVSLITSSLPTSRTRLNNVQVKGRLQDGFTDSSFLVDLSDIFISHFRDCHFGFANNVLRIRGDAGSGSAGATSALFFDNCTFQYAGSSGLLEHIDGQYSVHHNECTFERVIGGASNAKVRVDSINATSGRPFNKVTYNQCHIEECDFEFNAEGCSITDSHIGESSVIMGDLSQACSVLDNSVASVGGVIIDAGYKNKFSGVWMNTDFNGVKEAGLPEKGQILYDSGFNGIEDDEYLIIARKWPDISSELTDNFFTGQIEIVNGSSSIVASSGIFTVRESSSDPGSHTKITKQTKTYLETVRIDATGVVDLNNASQSLALKNLIKNGTFKGNLLTDWLTVDTVTASAGTLGTSIGSANPTWGIYQGVPTVPGRTYVAVIKGDEGASGNMWIGDCWNGSRGARRALSGSYEMDGAFYGFIYFEAVADTTRISVGNLSANTFDVKSVAVVDVSDDKVYSSQAPSTGITLSEPVYNTNRVAGQAMSWIRQDDTTGWVQFGGAYA